jgi:hypothetical protein
MDHYYKLVDALFTHQLKCYSTKYYETPAIIMRNIVIGCRDGNTLYLYPLADIQKAYYGTTPLELRDCLHEIMAICTLPGQIAMCKQIIKKIEIDFHIGTGSDSTYNDKVALCELQAKYDKLQEQYNRILAAVKGQ